MAGRVGPDDPAAPGHGVHDPHPVLIEQPVELASQGTEATGLDLDQLAVGADQVDHPALDRNLEAITRSAQVLLERGVQRSLRQLADAHAVTLESERPTT